MWAVHGVSGGGRGGCGNDAPFPTAGIIIFCGYSVVQSDLVHLVLGHPALRGLTRRLGSLSWGLLAMPLVPLLIVPIPLGSANSQHSSERLAAEACSGADEHTTDRSKLVKVADK